MSQKIIAIVAEVCSKEGGAAIVMGLLENLSDGVTEGQSNVRVEEEWVDRGGWKMLSNYEGIAWSHDI